MPAKKGLPPWGRLDLSFWQNPQLRACPIEARYLFHALWAHSAQLGLDGWLPRNSVDMLASDFPKGPKRSLEALDDVRLIELNGGASLYVPKYARWQDTAEEIEAAQAAADKRRADNARAQDRLRHPEKYADPPEEQTA